jgi:four helix bundle protein
MIKSSDYRNLKVWQKAIELTSEVYKLVKLLPNEERYALSDQIRRAVVSVPSNIAEGRGRGTNKEFVRYLLVSRGSLWEVSTQLEICEKLQYLNHDEMANARQLITEISKMINALASSFSNDSEEVLKK